MLKLIASIVAGVFVSFSLVLASDAVSHAMASAAAGTPPDPGDRAALEGYVHSLPPFVLASMLLGWTVATLVGSWIAGRFGGRGPWPGWVVAGAFLLATASNFLMIPHPVWMIAAGVALICGAGWLGARLGAGSVRAASA